MMLRHLGGGQRHLDTSMVLLGKVDDCTLRHLPTAGACEQLLGVNFRLQLTACSIKAPIPDFCPPQLYAISIWGFRLDFCPPQVYATNLHAFRSDFCPPQVYATNIHAFRSDFCPPQVYAISICGFLLILWPTAGVRDQHIGQAFFESCKKPKEKKLCKPERQSSPLRGVGSGEGGGASPSPPPFFWLKSNNSDAPTLWKSCLPPCHNLSCILHKT